MKHRIVAVAAGASVVLASCGSSTSTENSVAETLPDAADLIEDAEAQGISPLALAFDQAADATSYRAEIAMGMTMSLGEAGSIEFPADPATPMSYVEVDADGEQYTLIDLAPMMNAILSSPGMDGGGDAMGMLGGDLSMETWLAGSTITIDVSGFAPMLQQAPGSAGIFPAEVFTVDIDRFADGLGAPDVASSMAGQAAPDPAEMASVLRDALADADSEDGERYAGTLTLVEYSAAFGQDIEELLGALGPADSFSGADVAAAHELFDQVTADVEVTLADGVVDTLRFEIDFSAVMGDLAAQAGGTASGTPADATFVMTMLMDYEIDPTIDVVVPAGDFPDGTDQYVALLNRG